MEENKEKIEKMICDDCEKESENLYRLELKQLCKGCFLKNKHLTKISIEEDFVDKCDNCKIRKNLNKYKFNNKNLEEIKWFCSDCLVQNDSEKNNEDKQKNNIKQIKKANNILSEEVEFLKKLEDTQPNEEWAIYIICFIFLPITLPILLIRWLILNSRKQNLEIIKLIENNEE